MVNYTMILNRKAALILLFINSIYVLYYIALMVYLKERLIINYDKRPVELPLSLWITNQAIMLPLSIISVAGLVLVLKICKQHYFIIATVALYVLMRLVVDISGIFIATGILKFNMLLFTWFTWISLTIYLFFAISVFFIKNRSIKKYYVWHAMILITSIILTPVTNYLYSDFGLTWILVNPNVLKITPFFVSLALYHKLYKVSSHQIQ